MKKQDEPPTKQCVKQLLGGRCPQEALQDSNYCKEHSEQSSGGGGGGGGGRWGESHFAYAPHDPHE